MAKQELDFYGFFDYSDADDGTERQDVYEYTAEEWSDFIKCLIGNGISKFSRNSFNCSGGYVITVMSGNGFIEGHYFINENPINLEADKSSSVNSVVIHMSIPERIIYVEVLPQRVSTLVNSEDDYYLPLFEFTVNTSNGYATNPVDYRTYIYNPYETVKSMERQIQTAKEEVMAAIPTSLNNVGGTLAINKGGTGATTAANARSNLGITPANIGAATAAHKHPITDIADIYSGSTEPSKPTVGAIWFKY